MKGLADSVIVLSMRRSYHAVLCLALLTGSSCAAAVDQTVASVEFDRDVAPILDRHCVVCHGPEKQESGLRLDVPKFLHVGGDRGPSVVAGNSKQSILIRALTGKDNITQMPDGDDPLDKTQIEIIRRWIDQGAQAPEDDAVSSRLPVESDHWAFQPIDQPRPPDVSDNAWIRNGVDLFVFARLNEESLRPSPQADRVTLIRRLNFDLLGLPPTPEEVDRFLNDNRPGAYDRLVDRLVDSPHFGERWGRHWLDVARYADSDGYNYDRPRSIWKYRDWVIEAINRDLPFDQFTIDQLAGDLLDDATCNQQVATGFHRNTLYNREGGNDPEQYRIERIVDRVNTTGTVFLGLTVGCAECHAHKYDPFSQREFYELFAFFNNCDEPELSLPTPSEQERIADIDRQIAEIRKQTEIPENAGPKRQTRIDELKKSRPKPATTLVIAERTTDPRTTAIHIRGDFKERGAVVTANVPRVLPSLKSTRGRFDRLDLAHWLFSEENPLTARVTVNRIWQQYFGKGLVETENDFGTQGELPTHPELLDWLADEFRSGGWQVKRIHRLILTSATYRQSSQQSGSAAERDPANRLLARQVRLRLPAECIRDSCLAVSGLLSGRIGGPSVFPWQPEGIMDVRREPRPWTISSGTDRYRRGMYTHFWRTSPHPFLTTFDAPLSDVCSTRRTQSNTPLQALMLLNDPTFLECAAALARRILTESPSNERINYAFRLCVSRTPSPEERKSLQRFIELQQEEFRKHPDTAAALPGDGATSPTGDPVELAAWIATARVLLNIDEFITRE